MPRPSYPPYSASGEDEGRVEVDRLLTATEKKVHGVYEQAAQEMKKKADAYLAQFTKEDRERALRVANGEMTVDEYKRWRTTHILQGRRYYEMAEVLAADMTNSDKIAAAIINGSLPDVFAVGYNYALYQGELTGGFQTSFTLYDRDTVTRLMQEDPELLPVQAKINVPEEMRWNKRHISSSMTQSIMQGEMLEDIAKRLASSVASMNERQAIRNARTAYTSAENGGRYNGFRRLTNAGVNLVLEWCATLDSRTRHEHRLLDGQRRNVDEAFEVDGQKILYAGDPYAPQGLIWNCRCTILSWVKGFEENREIKAAAFPDGESYAEWKFAKQEQAKRKEKPRYDNPAY